MTAIKSSTETLKKRGYVKDLDLNDYEIDLDYNLKLIESKNAHERTIAAHMLKYYLSNSYIIKLLLDKLCIEKALYTKLEISKTLSYSENNLDLFIKYLGKIKNKQYTSLPTNVSNKYSYPLPRDIIARIIGNMNINNLDFFIAQINKVNPIVLRELIDGIGYLISKNKVDNKQIIFYLNLLYLNTNDDLIKWRIIITYGYLKPESNPYLENIINTTHSLLQKEAIKAVHKKKAH